MTVVRRATEDDVPALVALGERFIMRSPYGASLDVTADDLDTGIRLALLARGVAFIAEVNGDAVGAIIGAVTPIWCSARARVGAELAWWVDDAHRGKVLGIRLLQAFESWAKEQGASHVVMSDLVFDGDAPVGPMFERLGYRLVERSHLKEL